MDDDDGGKTVFKGLFKDSDLDLKDKDKGVILIVDDDRNNILVLEYILKAGGFSVLTATNGKEAITLAQKNLPTLILLDVKLPESDGFEICQQLKKDELTSLIPVIFVSALNDENSKIQGFHSGGSDFITKPFHHQELLARVNTHLSVRNLQLNFEKQNEQLKLEITDRLKTEAQLKESEERYRLISNVSTDYMFSTRVLPDGTLDLDWVVGAFESISGYSVEEFKARGAWRATIHPDDLHIDDNDIVRLRNNKDTESEIRTYNRNGEIVWVQVFAHPVWDDKNNCLRGIYGAVKNITDRKTAEEMLLKSEIRFRKLLEEVNLIAVILDVDGKVTFCNDFLLKLTGFSHDEMIGCDWFNRMIPEEQPDVKELFLNGLKEGIIAPYFENPIVAKDGKLRQIVWSNTIQRNSDDSISGIASIGEDITERIRMENILHKNNEQLKLILENTPIAIWDWNIKTDKWFATQKYYTMLGYEPENENPDRKVWLKRVHPDDREIVQIKIENVLNHTDEQYYYHARMLHADGSYRWQKVIGQIVERDDNGNAIRILGVRMDIHESKQAEEKIFELNEELERKVTERTLELEQKNADLQRMNKLFVGRELRMVELKDEIKVLETKLLRE